MSKIEEITPTELFETVKKNPDEVGWEVIEKAYERYQSVQNKSRFLQPTIDFVKEAGFEDERADDIRSWGTAALGEMEGENAEQSRRFLTRLLKEEKTKELARKFLWTRFNALRALWHLAKDSGEKKELSEILLAFTFNDDEDFLNQALACVILVRNETSNTTDKKKALKKIKDMLSPNGSEDGKFKGYLNKGTLAESYWPAYRALEALKEIPLEQVCKDIIKVVTAPSPYYDHKTSAIEALGGYERDGAVADELGFIVRRNKDSNLRLLAVISLGSIKHPEATGDLLKALVDENAEIREKASDALEKTLGDKSTALRLIVEEAMKEGIEGAPSFDYLVEALRRIDRKKELCPDVLARELESDDPNRAQRAQKILYEIGGIEAVQKLNRRRTLEKSYELLEQSETQLQNAFQSTTLQATRNFYFMMGINAVIVSVGIVLIGLAVWQVLVKPDNFAGWITPGTGGVFGIILTLWLNGPRKNAREDLKVLMDANVIYLGYLRMLNEIDATFKHDYVENPSFGAGNMVKTVSEINNSLKTVLNLTGTHLCPTERGDTSKGIAPKPENENPKQEMLSSPLESQ